MPRFVIERNIPGAGKLGPRIQWVQSYVTDTLRSTLFAPISRRG